MLDFKGWASGTVTCLDERGIGRVVMDVKMLLVARRDPLGLMLSSVIDVETLDLNPSILPGGTI